ncbi:uncharacterized protein VNE69_03340 [Vairimorpha necatrix]|uniref:Cyclin N-terminal domain-containing protein n=1 Tax=Vairimorpha necatrix TaxID=6039 RepID=A0AAX4JB10_9MICR
MRYEKVSKVEIKDKWINNMYKEDISDKIIRMVIETYSNYNCTNYKCNNINNSYTNKYNCTKYNSYYYNNYYYNYSRLLDFKNILPLYLITGFIYLRKYLKNVKKGFRDSILFKLFLTCIWMGIKNYNDLQIQDFLESYRCDYKEITFIEANILSKINYDIDITENEMMNWDIN